MMKKKPSNRQKGRVISMSSGVGRISGLKSVFIHETLVDDDNKAIGFIVGFEKEYVEALFFKDSFDYNIEIYNTGKPISFSISDSIIGRVTSPLGEPLDGFGPITGPEKSVFAAAPQIIDREPVEVPLTTGIKLIDSLLPIGRGQRELIIGDRKLGKTTLATDIVLNQLHANEKVHCIYVIIGQKYQKLTELIHLFNKNNSFLYTTIIAATANSSYSEKYLAPFVGCAIGEYFRDNGDDALIVYDDLTQHAKSYRDISLLLGRAPGREAYPGNIFTLHAHLLERSAKLAQDKGGGSLTALPIIETQEGDITSFIPTNIISITDGQIYFDRSIFQKGELPAINIGLSVSRIGSKAQQEPLKAVAAGLRLTLSQHRELQKLAQLETVKSKQAIRKIHRGQLLLELLKQEKSHYVSWQEQVILLYVVEKGSFDDISPKDWRKFEELFIKLITYKYPTLVSGISTHGLTSDCKVSIDEAVSDFKNEFIT